MKRRAGEVLLAIRGFRTLGLCRFRLSRVRCQSFKELRTAIRARDFDAVRQILEKHQDPNCCDEDDCAARVACIAGRGDILEILLQAGDVKFRSIAAIGLGSV